MNRALLELAERPARYVIIVCSGALTMGAVLDANLPSPWGTVFFLILLALFGGLMTLAVLRK